MYIYCTSKNTGPTWTGPDPVHLLYIGSSVDDAEKAVGDFSRYAKEDCPNHMPYLYSALPREMEREMIQFFMADGWWYSIERFEVSDA